MAKEYSKAFYKSSAWQECRKYILMRDRYCCVRCGKPASDVHHITYITKQNINDPNVTLNPANLISLCKDCHNKEHHKNNDNTECVFDEGGQMVGIAPR